MYPKNISAVFLLSITVLLSFTANAQSSGDLKIDASENDEAAATAAADEAAPQAPTGSNDSLEPADSENGSDGAAVIDPSGKWFVSLGGVVTGPFTAVEIHEKIDQKVIGTDALVAREGTTDWFDVTELPQPSDIPSAIARQNAQTKEIEKWWVTRDGATIGPFTVSVINEMIQKKEIVPTTDVCRYGTKKWIKANTVFKFVQPASAAANAQTATMVDNPTVEYKRSRAARSTLLQIGVSLLASGAVLMVSSIACVARGDAPEGSEWALNNEACVGTLLGSGAILGVISIPFIVGANAKKNPSTVSALAAPDRLGLILTKTF